MSGLIRNIYYLENNLKTCSTRNVNILQIETQDSFAIGGILPRGGVGWMKLPKTKNIKAIIAYELSRCVPFSESQMPEGGKFLTLPKMSEGVEVLMSVFMEFIKIPIIVYGDNLPKTDEHLDLYQWADCLYLM